MALPLHGLPAAAGAQRTSVVAGCGARYISTIPLRKRAPAGSSKVLVPSFLGRPGRGLPRIGSASPSSRLEYSRHGSAGEGCERGTLSIISL